MALTAMGQTPRIYEESAGTAAAAFPDAGRAGSALHKRMAEIERDLERKQDPLAHAATRRVILAVRAAADLLKERPEAAPNALEVAARCLGLVEKEYGDLSDPASPFAKVFWELVPEVRTQLPEFDNTGAWPLAAGAMAQFRLAGKPGGGAGEGADFNQHQDWLAASGRSEWPPRERMRNGGTSPLTQTGPDTWQSNDGLTIVRTGSGQYQVRK